MTRYQADDGCAEPAVIAMRSLQMPVAFLAIVMVLSSDAFVPRTTELARDRRTAHVAKTTALVTIFLLFVLYVFVSTSSATCLAAHLLVRLLLLSSLIARRVQPAYSDAPPSEFEFCLHYCIDLLSLHNVAYTQLAIFTAKNVVQSIRQPRYVQIVAFLSRNRSQRNRVAKTLQDVSPHLSVLPSSRSS